MHDKLRIRIIVFSSLSSSPSSSPTFCRAIARASARFSSFLSYRYPIITAKREMAVGIIIEMSRDRVIKLSRKTSIRTTNTVTRNSRHTRRCVHRYIINYTAHFRHFMLVNTHWMLVILIPFSSLYFMLHYVIASYDLYYFSNNFQSECIFQKNYEVTKKLCSILKYLRIIIRLL